MTGTSRSQECLISVYIYDQEYVSPVSTWLGVLLASSAPLLAVSPATADAAKHDTLWQQLSVTNHHSQDTVTTVISNQTPLTRHCDSSYQYLTTTHCDSSYPYLTTTHKTMWQQLSVTNHHSQDTVTAVISNQSPLTRHCDSSYQ